ncbi:MAG: hypothetical protein IJ702_06780 [Fretibacterium sp.]|nr:hypothetical protein [Fretibacterium sp.]
MRGVISQKTAQTIAETTSEVLDYGVLVTDEGGIIIGCSERERLGRLHAPSLEVMERNEPRLTTQDEAAVLGVRPGYTAPITLSGKVVGTVSIAGLPQDVERYGRLVRKQAEILLVEQNFLERKLSRQLAMRDLAENILLCRPEDGNANSLLLYGRDLGFDLTRYRIAVVVGFRRGMTSATGTSSPEMMYNRLMALLASSGHFIAPLRTQQVVLFLALNANSYG